MMSKIQELIDHLKSHFPAGVHLVLSGEAKHELEERNREIAQLANQRDQVQLELDQAKLDFKRCQQALKITEGREANARHSLQRKAEGLIAAENDLADLRWLVHWARQGGTAPVCASVNPPPHVGSPNATAQAEGGAK